MALPIGPSADGTEQLPHGAVGENIAGTPVARTPGCHADILADVLWHSFAAMEAFERRVWVECMWKKATPALAAHRLGGSTEAVCAQLRSTARSIDERLHQALRDRSTSASTSAAGAGGSSACDGLFAELIETRVRCHSEDAGSQHHH